MPRRQFPHAFDKRPVAEHATEGEILDDARGIELRANGRVRKDRTQLARSDEQTIRNGVVERLHSDLIARGKQLAPLPVPEHEGEHSPEARQRCHSVRGQAVEHDLGVGPRSKGDPSPLEVGLQLTEVEKLPVVDDRPATAWIAERLIRLRIVRIDDRQPAVLEDEAEIRSNELAFAVRPAMTHVRECPGVRTVEETRIQRCR